MGDDQVVQSRLLIVDDDQSFGRLIKRVAEPCGFEVIATDDPGNFTHVMRCWSPGVVVLDLQIPGTDGIELLRKLAVDGCAAHVILASGVDEKTLDSALQLGRERGLKMAGTLAKPVDLQGLRELLAKFRPIDNAQLMRDLDDAIPLGHLFLEYQPKLDCRSGRITGVEALVRWQHPTLGLVRPDRFITLAEETSLIGPLTEWVASAAIRQTAAWRRQGLDLDVAINISAKNAQDITLPDRLAHHCSEHGVEPGSIVLELTETGAMGNAVQLLDVLTRLRLKGFELAIDDFGTGYSSLVQLRKMPFSELKVDCSFVMQMTTDKDSRFIVETVIELARKLGLRSVAEGVETETALTALLAMGCDLAQGYHLSRPLAAGRLARFVNDREQMQTPPSAPPISSPAG
jgi:EAL domain-containing protein (putative c-di-GMP-specific phosphodiesterase class I)/ActR/RegA family two-component response regulator